MDSSSNQRQEFEAVRDEMVYSPPGEGSAEYAERQQSDDGTGGRSHCSVKAKVAALERSSPVEGSPGVTLRDLSTKVKAMREQAQQSRETRGTGRSKSKRGDDPSPCQVPKHTTSPKERIIPDARDDYASLDGSEDLARRLELLEARSRCLMDTDMTSSEADRFDLVELISKQKWKFVLRRLEQKPAEARIKHEMMLGGLESQEPIETRALPIHKALCLKPPLNVVESLLAACPDSIKVIDERWGRLPIHLALLNNADAQIIKLLVVSFPTSVQIAEKKDGRVPLHLACLFGSPYEVSLLLNADETSIDARDRLGKTPLELTFQSTNYHRESIMARLKTNNGRSNPSPQRSRLTLQHQPMQASAQPESPRATNIYNKTKSARWMGRKKDQVAALVVSDLKNEGSIPAKRNRDTGSFTMTMASSDTFSLQSCNSGESSSRSLFRRSRGRSIGYVPRPRSASRERGLLSRFGKSCASHKENPNDFERLHANGLDGETVADDRTVASMPAIVPYSPITNIAQFSAQHQETPSRTRTGGNDLSKFLEQTSPFESTDDMHEAMDVRSLPALSSEQKKKREKRRECSLERIDSTSISERGSAFHQVSPRNDSDCDFSSYVASPIDKAKQDLSLVGSGNSTEIAANPPFASPPSAQTARIFNHSSTSSDQHLHSLSEDSTNDEGEDDEGEDDRSLASTNDRAMYRHFSTAADKNSEHAALESHLRHLDMKKEALVEECNHLSETILSKRELADKARGRIQTYQQKMASLQLKIEKEQANLQATESRMHLHNETLKGHQSKLKSVMLEIRVLQSIRENRYRQDLDGGSYDRQSTIDN